MDRRTFVKNAAILTGLNPLSEMTSVFPEYQTAPMVKVIHTQSNFEREKLLRPFGFKGGFLTELWQTAVKLQSEKFSGIGLATQSVLYGDADLFVRYSEAGGNALMYALTEKALRQVKETPFSDPVTLLDKIHPQLYEEAKRMTGKNDLNENFLMNAMVSVDNAAWLLYAAETGRENFYEMLPSAYKPALSYKNKKVAFMFQVSYGMPLEELVKAAKEGYFIIKIKTGQPGTQSEMLEKDMARLSQIHQALKNFRTDHTSDGKLIYTLDANARYEKKETLQRYLDHARKIGAFSQILFIEEPLNENNSEDVSDTGVRIGADESVHDEATALRRLKQGYSLMVLKGIAKTLSKSLKIAKLAHDRNVPCILADLTVNPILIDWNKNLAARVKPFPGMDMGMIETNGDANYVNWQAMLSRHPAEGASWTLVNKGVFELNDEYFSRSGGIFEKSPHYEAFLK